MHACMQNSRDTVPLRFACMSRFRIRISMHACLNSELGCVCICQDRSTAHSAQWQDVELIIRRPTQHRNRPKRRERVAYASLRPAERFMRACLRPTEAACFPVRKCANNRQLIVAGIQRFVGYAYAYAARFRIIQTCKTLCALLKYTQTLIGVFFIHGNGNTHACLTYTMMKSVLLRWTLSCNNRSKLKGECTDVKSGRRTSVGPSLNPHSLS